MTDPADPAIALLHWQCGYAYAMNRVIEAADDVVHARSLAPATTTHEQRVKERMDEMEAQFGPPTYKGGPVAPW